MSLRNDIVRFWFWGFGGEIKTELQAPVVLGCNVWIQPEHEQITAIGLNNSLIVVFNTQIKK